MFSPAGGLSIPEFRAKYGLSKAQYETMQEKGLGPKETLFPESNVRRILPPAEKAWLELINRPDIQMAEAKRRTAIARRCGLAALQSPAHPANIYRRAKASEKSNKAPKGKLRKHLQAAE
jgi:hypothetical protein